MQLKSKTNKERRGSSTFKGGGELLDVGRDEAVEVISGPDGIEEDADDDANGAADAHRGQPLQSQLRQLLYAVARHGDEAVREDEYQHAVVVPALHPRDEAREGGRRPCFPSSRCLRANVTVFVRFFLYLGPLNSRLEMFRVLLGKYCQFLLFLKVL